MKIVLIGSGNVAFHLGLALKKAGHKIVQVYGRSLTPASALAKKLGCQYTTNANELSTKTDFYLIALRDEAIADFIRLIPNTDSIVVHTSGSVPLSVLEKRFKNSGVIYPVQSFSKERRLTLSGIPFSVETSNLLVEKKIKSLLRPLSKNVHMMNSSQRLILHLSAVLANNFTNHLFSLSENLLRSHKLDFDILRPLILETAKKVQHQSPAVMQTGPARRGDSSIIEKHLELLKDQPNLQKIYKLITESIEDLNVPRL